VVREELTDFGFTGAFDPTGEYLGTAWSWYQQMLIRGLLMYPAQAGEEGNACRTWRRTRQVPPTG
jgi:hypothetical protein